MECSVIRFTITSFLDADQCIGSFPDTGGLQLVPVQDIFPLMPTYKQGAYKPALATSAKLFGEFKILFYYTRLFLTSLVMWDIFMRFVAVSKRDKETSAIFCSLKFLFHPIFFPFIS